MGGGIGGSGGGMSIRRGGRGLVGEWTCLWYIKRCSAMTVNWIGLMGKGVSDE